MSHFERFILYNLFAVSTLSSSERWDSAVWKIVCLVVGVGAFIISFWEGYLGFMQDIKRHKKEA
jgi:hypothetical protein